MRKFTTYIIGNITVRESDVPDTIEMSIGGKDDFRVVLKSDFFELCELRYTAKFAYPEREVIEQTDGDAGIGYSRCSFRAILTPPVSGKTKGGL